MRAFESVSAKQARTTGTVALIIIAAVTRFWRISHKSIWLDEALSWRSARMSLSNMLDYTGAADKHPPLYYGALHFWIKAFGDSEVALRSLSAVAGISIVVVLAAVCYRVRGPLLATVVAALMLVNSTDLYFSQEVRMYELAGLFALASSAALGLLIERPTTVRVAVYAALLSALVYTHYSGFVVVAVQGVLVLGYGARALWRERRPHTILAGACAFAVTALLYIPWQAHFRETARAGASDVPQATRNLVIESFKAAAGLAKAGDVWLIPIVAFMLLGAIAVARRWRDPLLVCVAAIALVPVGQLIIAVVKTPIFDLRQISPYVSGLVLLTGLGIVEAIDLARRLAPRVTLVASGAIGMLVLTLFGLMAQDLRSMYEAPPIEDWRTASNDLRSYDGPVYISAVYAVSAFQYYHRQNVYSFGLWAPGALPVGQQAMIGVSHSSDRNVLAALGTNVAIEGHRVYKGVGFYDVRVLHHAAVNVQIPFDNLDSGWSVNADGYLQTTANRNEFTCECQLDANGDGQADEASSFVIEYFDAGTAPVQLFDLSSRALLGSATRSNTNEWVQATIKIPAGTPVGSKFALSGGVTLRRLQLMRTEFESADVLGTYQASTRWLVRSDGYLESTDAHSYIDTPPAVDPQNDGVIDQGVRITLEYQAPGNIRVFGLSPGLNWTPQPLTPTPLPGAGPWRSLSVDLPAGAHLQRRIYVEKSVTLRSVRVTPLS